MTAIPEAITLYHSLYGTIMSKMADIRKYIRFNSMIEDFKLYRILGGFRGLAQQIS